MSRQGSYCHIQPNKSDLGCQGVIGGGFTRSGEGLVGEEQLAFKSHPP
jgi:hypothetical protein